MSSVTKVHLLRHGEVHNPNKILYGRLPGFHLSELGQQMAHRVARFVTGSNITHLVSSPMERAIETATPISQALGLEIHVDERLIESTNVFEGKNVGVGDGVLSQPKYWRHLWNPFRPSWGEHYVDVATRMTAAISDAAQAARGREALLVSHQLPIWIARLHAERRRLWHDPRRRQCALASLTTFIFRGDSDVELVAVEYAEPAADLLGGASRIAGA